MQNAIRLLLILALSFVACQSNQTNSESGQKTKVPATFEKTNQQNDDVIYESTGPPRIVFKGSQESAKEEIAQFETFINDFIYAVKNKDTGKIKIMTHFPFDTKGTRVENAILSYSAHDFLAVFSAFIKQDLGLEYDDPGLPERFEKYMEVNKAFSINKHNGKLGGMKFTKMSSGWKFTWVTLTDESIFDLQDIQPEKIRVP